MADVLEHFPNTRARVERRSGDSAASVRPARCDRAAASEAVRFVLETCGLRGRTALDKRVPAIADRWDREGITALVGKLFQGDGCIHAPTRSIYYATSSRGLAADVQRLLLKLDLPSTIHTKSFAYRGGRRTGYTVNLTGGRASFERFQALVGPHLVGDKPGALAALVGAFRGAPGLLARGTVDVVPAALCLEPVREAVLKHYPSLAAGARALGISHRLLFGDTRKRGMRRDTLAWLARRLDSPTLESLADAPVAWSRPKGYAREGTEATYDFEVPGAASFIANGIAVHNSHAACYGLVAYQTAYLKANYPVEYMAALLTSEMEKTDKIVQYMDECRAMGLAVVPPDVNLSGSKFTVAGDTIRFGLAAIKNVGATAIESIIALRESSGPFTGLADFCTRVDLRMVNRRVFESLIKAGAFDSLRATRASLLAGLDQAMEGGQRRQREREEGQGSLFDALVAGPEAAAAPESPLPSMPEWSHDQLLGYEKEVLGFYLSGHPLERYRETARQLGSLSVTELASRPVGARVAVLGQIGSVRERATKSGNRMAFATLEAVDGAVALTIFPEALKTCGPALRSTGPVLVKGRIDDTDKGRVLLTEEIHVVNGEPAAANGHPGRGGDGGASAHAGNGNGNAHAHTCRIRVRADGPPIEDRLAEVRALCQAYPGTTPLFLHVLLADHEVVVKVSGGGVSPEAELVTGVERLLGRGSVIVEYAGRA